MAPLIPEMGWIFEDFMTTGELDWEVVSSAEIEGLRPSSDAEIPVVFWFGRVF